MLDGWVVIIIYMIQYVAVNFLKKKSEEIKGRSCSTTPGIRKLGYLPTITSYQKS